jgi:hypothetical protein
VVVVRSLVMILLFACQTTDPSGGSETQAPGSDEAGLLGLGRAHPFPNQHLMVDGHLNLPTDLPHADTPLPVDRLAWRTGFSAVQVSVLQWPGLRAEGLPSWRTPTPGEGSVRMADLTDGVWLPAMAELDAHPLAGQNPSLLVRPLTALQAGHRIAVAVTTEVMDRPERFDRLLSANPPQDFAHQAGHYQSLADDLDALGLPSASLALAWDFPIDPGTTPVTSAMEARGEPGDWGVDDVTRAEDGLDGYLEAQGWFEMTDFLDEEGLLDLDAEGRAQPVGTSDAKFTVYIPESVADAPEGTVPIMLWGHGLFSRPSLDTKSESLRQIVKDGEYIFVGTPWTGLDYEGSVTAIVVANDLGQLPKVTDPLVQSHVALRTLATLLQEGGILSDEALRGRQGQVLANPDELVFYGISAGAIEGAVAVANGLPVDAAVLHVGGGGFSTLLERSRNWVPFESVLEDSVEDAADRQLLLSFSQLLWDPVDPMAWTPQLRDRAVLLQEARGDDAVHNLTTRTLARAIELPVLEPAVDPPWGLDLVSPDLPSGSRAMVQFDPMRGEPEEGNRPAETTGAHDTVVSWHEARTQALHFLATDGEVIHLCGAEPCTDDNRQR